MKAWALLVVSSEIQAETLPDQRSWAQGVAAEKGWTLERVFEDVATGKRGVRRTMTELIAALRAVPPPARPDWVLMIRADRVGRGRIAESQIALHEIVDLGCRIWTRNEGEIRLDTAMDQLISAARQATAAFENEVRREKAEAYYGKRRATGAPSVTNKRPYGLRVVKGGQLEPVPGEAEIVQKIFEMRIAGAGANAIGAAVRPLAPAPLRKDGTPRKAAPRWMPYTIVRMIRNPKYRGTIVDEVTWHRAQTLPPQLVTRMWNTTPKYPWPLVGALRCWCDGPLYGEPGGNPKRRIRYYRCRREDRHAGDRRPGWRADRLEAAFLAMLKDLYAHPGSTRRVVAGPSPAVLDRALRAARSELAELSARREKVWELHAAGKVRDEDVQERLDALGTSRGELEARITALEAERAVAVATRREGPLKAEAIARAIAAWSDPRATAQDQRAVAVALATYRGGLYVTRDGELAPGRPERAKAQVVS